MASRITGPVKNTELSRGTREWFSNRPVGTEPDIIEYMNDFLVAGDYSASDWVVTETDSSATQAIAADVVGGALALVNSSTDDHVNQLQSAEEWFGLSPGKQAWFEIRVKCEKATQSEFFVGFCTTDTDIWTATTDSVGFRKVDATASLTSLTEDNTTETTNTVATVVADTYMVLGFHYDGAGKVKFFVDRSLAATHTTHIETTNNLALTISLKNGEGSSTTTLTVDYIYVALER
jgi:hypothetical protein